MRYSFVLATLAASAIATPYINVEVSEPGDLLDETSRQGNHHRGMRRHDRKDDERRHGRGRNWFTSLWGNDNDMEEESRRREREDRRSRRNQNRNRRHSRGRRERERDNEDEDFDGEFSVERYSAGNLIDDLFGTDFECVIQADSQHEERRNARECCRQAGGELYDQPGRCIFRDVFENPREEWRDCALEVKGTNFADCYYREQREVDDSLSSRRRSQRDSRGSRDSRDRRNRSRSRSRNGKQRLFELEQDNGSTSHAGRIQCEVNMNDQDRERQVVRQCCNDDQVQGRLNHNDERCEIRERRQLEQFLNCAQENTADEEAGRCYREGNNRDF